MATDPVLISFEEALQRTEEGKKKHVLLGNGFSRACRNDIFAYEALFDRADFTGIPLAQAAFQALNTTDFEVVMNALRMAAALVCCMHLLSPTSPEHWSTTPTLYGMSLLLQSLKIILSAHLISARSNMLLAEDS